MKLVIPKGSTSRIVTVFIQDSSATDGSGLGSLDESSSIVGGFVREGSTGVALAVDEDVTTEGTYQAPSASGKVRIGTPANMRTGTYELHFDNALFATGAEYVVVTLGGAANMAPLTLEIQLSDPIRGLGSPTGIPNFAATAAGGLSSDLGLLKKYGYAVIEASISAVGSSTSLTISGGPAYDIASGIAILSNASDSNNTKAVACSYVASGPTLNLEEAPFGAEAPTTSDKVTIIAIPESTTPVDANMTQMDGETSPVTNLAAAADAIIRGSAVTGTLSTTVMTTDLTGYADDELIGATVVWKSGTAAGQRSTITDYASSGGTITYDVIATAPANADTFVVV